MPLDSLKPRSDSAIVRNLLDEIERSIKAGASRLDVWKTLCAEQGLKLEFGSFTKALLRARRNREKECQIGELTSPVRMSSAETGNVDGATQKNDPVPQILDCTIQSATVRGARVVAENESESEPVPVPTKPRIRTSKDRENLPVIDFSDLDDRYK